MIASCQILRESLIAMAHQMMYGRESLEDNCPAAMLGSFYQQIGQLWNRNIRLVCARNKICNFWEIFSQLASSKLFDFFLINLSQPVRITYILCASFWDPKLLPLLLCKLSLLDLGRRVHSGQHLAGHLWSVLFPVPFLSLDLV